MIADINGHAEEQAPAGAHSVFVDALNVAYWCGDPPSLRIPLSLMSGLLAGGYSVILFFDASARSRLAHEEVVYAQLLQHPVFFIEAPVQKTADEVMLRHATATGACIVTKDLYRDHRKRYRKLIKAPGRLLAGLVQDDRVRIPAWALELPLASSANEAWRQLESWLGSSPPSLKIG